MTTTTSALLLREHDTEQPFSDSLVTARLKYIALIAWHGLGSPEPTCRGATASHLGRSTCTLSCSTFLYVVGTPCGCHSYMSLLLRANTFVVGVAAFSLFFSFFFFFFFFFFSPSFPSVLEQRCLVNAVLVTLVLKGTILVNSVF